MRLRIVIGLVFCLGVACEDVVEVDLPDPVPRLVVEGLLRVDEQEPFVPVRITLSETSGYFQPVPVTRAEAVLITVNRYEDGQLVEAFNSSLAEEVPGNGVYIPDPNATSDQRIPTFFLNEEVQFILQIRHRGRQYVAETWYQPVVPIDFLVQGKRTLREGDETEVLVAFTDLPQEDNFYLFDFSMGEYLVTEDTFYQGQFFQFSYFYEEPIAPETELTISILGADQQFYNYMDLLITQSELEGPFQPPVATARGNIVDATDIDNRDRFDNTDRPEVFPLGYFAVVQEHSRTLTIL